MKCNSNEVYNEKYDITKEDIIKRSEKKRFNVTKRFGVLNRVSSSFNDQYTYIRKG